MELKLRKMFENRLTATNRLDDFIQMFDVLTSSLWDLLLEDFENKFKENTSTERSWGNDIKENLRTYERKLKAALEKGPLLVEKNEISSVTTSLGESREGAEDAIIEYINEYKKTVSEEKKENIKEILKRYINIINNLLKSARRMYVKIGCEKYLEIEDFSDLDLKILIQRASTKRIKEDIIFQEML